ncbi:MAG: hypothetical protein A2X61_12305 [Ignavibacteria bacterium GWB2_35_12]|nr:MAG: hypothetical protein A2X61_12305 [Ignavibacteria bacterium GWB2_35_12]
MKKAKLLITICIVLLTFCVSAFATGDVHDGTTVPSRTGNGTFSCRTIAPLTIEVIPENVNSGLIFVINASGDVTYNLPGGYNAPHANFKVEGELGEYFATSLNMTVNGDGTASNELDHVKLNIHWYYSADGMNYFDFTATGSRKIINEGDTEGDNIGEYTIRAIYTSVTVEPDATPGSRNFQQTLTVWYTDGSM